jgi:hypothetical protein
MSPGVSPIHEILEPLAEIFEQVEFVCHLLRLGSAFAGGGGVIPSPIPADSPYFWMSAQPGFCRFGCPIGKSFDRLVRF